MFEGRKQRDAVGNPRNFAMIVKFRWDCENFAIIAKISQS